MKFSDADKALARALLLVCETPRDRLPYTAEFESLYEAFLRKSGRQIGRDTFWRLLSSAAKAGGLAKRRTRRAS